MTVIDLSLAPGCFGLGMVYRDSAKECISCPFQAQCAPLAATRLTAVRTELGIVERKKVSRPKPVETAPAGALTDYPKKVIELMERIDRAGIKVTEMLAARQNPFRSSPVFMRVTCHLLLGLGSIRRDVLQRALMSKLEWSEGTATAHAMQASQLLQALGAATEANGIITLRSKT